MGIHSHTQIPKPSDWKHFQRIACALFRGILKDPMTQENGGSGYEQKGVDVFGRRNAQPGYWVGVQCKLTEKKKLTRKQVKDEVALALKFKPELKEFFIFTTAADNPDLSELARELSDGFAADGKNFTIAVWGWDTISAEIVQYPEALQLALPEGSPILTGIAQAVDQLRDETVTPINELLSIARTFQGIFNTTNSPIETSSLSTAFDKQIDVIRDLISSGQPITAEKLLRELDATLPSNTEGRIRFRVKANLGAALLRINKLDEAANYYEEAYRISPDQEKSDAFYVLSMILRDHPEQAYEFGLKSLPTTKDKGSLVGYMITALKRRPDLGNVEDLVTEDVRDKEFVWITEIDYYRATSDTKRWIDLASIAAVRFPESKAFKQYNAEAKLEKALKQYSSQVQNGKSTENIKLVESAVSDLRPLWDEALKSEVQWDDYHLCLSCNLATCYRFLGDYRSAMDIVSLMIDHVTTDPKANEIAFIIASESRDDQRISKLLPLLPPSRDALLGKIQYYASEPDWPKVLEVCNDSSHYELSVDDDAFVASAQIMARHKLALSTITRAEYQDLKAKFPQTIVDIMFYEIARDQKDDQWCNEIYNAILVRAEELHPADRSMAADIAIRREDHANVAKLVGGQVSTKFPSLRLRALAGAYTSSPPSLASDQFAKEIAHNLPKDSHYQKVAGYLFYNSGHLKRAKNCLSRAIELNPRDLAAHFALLQCFVRQNKTDEVKRHINNLNLSSLEGDPVQKMGFSQLLMQFAFLTEALALGYKTAIDNPDNPRVQILFVGLMLGRPLEQEVPVQVDKVVVDCWVRLQRSDGTYLEIIIDNFTHRHRDHFVSLHALSQAILGKSVGDQVQYDMNGNQSIYVVQEIKHKYAALLNKIMTTHHERYPEDRSFYSIRTSDGDTTPILEIIKQHSERDALLLDQYQNGAFPLCLLANLSGADILAVADKIKTKFGRIFSCRGTLDERAAAIRFCRTFQKKGAVLDAYSAYCAAQFDLLPYLKTYFKSVVIAQSSFDELIQIRTTLEGYVGKDFMTVSYENGQFYRRETTKDRVLADIQRFNTILTTITDNCELIAPTPSEEDHPLYERVVEVAGYGVFDAARIAQQNDLILISEDMYFRQLCTDVFKVAGIWLQASLNCICLDNVITIDQYARSVASIAIMQHSYVSLEALTLLRMLHDDNQYAFQRFSIAASFIGQKDSDLGSNLAVVLEFIRVVWFDTSLTRLQRLSALGIIFAQLIALGDIHSCTGRLISLVHTRYESPQYREIIEYFEKWLIGHFIEPYDLPDK